jgi:rod shape determining protein RodA
VPQVSTSALPTLTSRSRFDLMPSVRRQSAWRRLDWPLMIAVLAMATCGALLVWSATKQKQISVGADPQGFLKRDLINLAIGLGLAAAAATIDYRVLRAYTPFLYGATLLGLVAVLAVGSTINGAHAWIVLPAGFELQPSEFAKVGLVLMMAMLLGEKRDTPIGVRLIPRDRDVLAVLAAAAVPLGLIMLQPDFGTAMVIIFCMLGVIAVSGASQRWVVGLIVVGVLFGGGVLHFHLLKPYQEARLTQFTKPDLNSQTTGYNTRQAKLADSGGSWWGQGLFHGQQTQGQFVPEQQTDFIFTVAGEELGLVGAGLLLGVFGFVLWRSLTIAARAPDAFGRLVATGVVCWWAIQGFINVGMTMGITPVTGLPMPFVSYGGSAMFANMIALGLLQNVRLRSNHQHL